MITAVVGVNPCGAVAVGHGGGKSTGGGIFAVSQAQQGCGSQSVVLRNHSTLRVVSVGKQLCAFGIDGGEYPPSSVVSVGGGLPRRVGNRGQQASGINQAHGAVERIGDAFQQAVGVVSVLQEYAATRFSNALQASAGITLKSYPLPGGVACFGQIAGAVEMVHRFVLAGKAEATVGIFHQRIVAGGAVQRQITAIFLENE